MYSYTFGKERFKNNQTSSKTQIRWDSQLLYMPDLWGKSDRNRISYGDWR